jgi:hypothetical protein
MKNCTSCVKVSCVFCNRCNSCRNRYSSFCSRCNSFCDCEDRSINRERFTSDRKVNRTRFRELLLAWILIIFVVIFANDREEDREDIYWTCIFINMKNTIITIHLLHLRTWNEKRQKHRTCWFKCISSNDQKCVILKKNYDALRMRNFTNDAI